MCVCACGCVVGMWVCNLQVYPVRSLCVSVCVSVCVACVCVCVCACVCACVCVCVVVSLGCGCVVGMWVCNLQVSPACSLYIEIIHQCMPFMWFSASGAYDDSLAHQLLYVH